MTKGGGGGEIGDGSVSSGTRPKEEEKIFREFFRRATGHEPFPYQVEMALGKELPQVVDIPAGAGKTAAAVLAWLWRRRFAAPEIRRATPRRLVYCLPMRVLVEQTRDCAVRWLDNLGILAGEIVAGSGRGLVDYGPCKGQSCTQQDSRAPTGFADGKGIKGDRISVTVLLGGEDKDGWDVYPERDAVIIGTQDMLLSRALNRGFGMSRYRWPLHFGLLNNDCLWVIDEAGLMGEGLATTAQLQAFREMAGHFGPAGTIWMGGALDSDWLGTVDFDPRLKAPLKMTLGKADLGTNRLAGRLKAARPITRSKSAAGDMAGLALEIVGAHKAGSRTLAVVNTLRRASELYAAVLKKNKGAETVLVHSHFRPPDRRRAVERLLAEPGERGVIAVSTGVIEAGVDVSARKLFTELAPWPYDGLDWYYDGAPKALSGVETPGPEGEVIRYKDILELFDTGPDISGHDVDISRYVRETNETDVFVFWRDLPAEGPGGSEPEPDKDELCPTPIGDVRELIGGRMEAWAMDSLAGRWRRLGGGSPLHPGMSIMFRASGGLYTEDEGWNPSSNAPVMPVPLTAERRAAGYGKDQLSVSGWKSLREHGDNVVEAMGRIVSKMGYLGRWRPGLLEAARWHDAGKAHAAFQARIRPEMLAEAPERPVAKAPEEAWLDLDEAEYERDGRLRKYFRHEMASGILALQEGKDDLVAYLAMAHHGKVRLTIRSLPDEPKPPELGRRFARGLWENDAMPPLDLGGGVKVGASEIGLGYMDLGECTKGMSWAGRALALRDRPDLGVFRLGFLEAVLKAADERASGGLL